MDSSPSSSIAATDKTNVGRGVAMSDDDIKQRLKGVCVYALTNSKKKFVLDKDENSVEAQAKLYFNEKDAKTSLKKVKLKNPGMLSNYEVAPFAVSDILKLMDDEYTFRFIPESKQIGNAVRKRRWHGFPDDSFPGVPVFKSMVAPYKEGGNKKLETIEELHLQEIRSTQSQAQDVNYLKVNVYELKLSVIDIKQGQEEQ